MDPACHVHSDRLARLRLDVLEEVDRVGLQDRHVRIGVQGVESARRVPGRTGGEHGALHEHDVCPAEFRKMVKNGGSNDAAPDDDHPVMRIHPSTLGEAGPESNATEVPSGRLDIPVHCLPNAFQSDRTALSWRVWLLSPCRIRPNVGMDGRLDSRGGGVGRVRWGRQRVGLPADHRRDRARMVAFATVGSRGLFRNV